MSDCGGARQTRPFDPGKAARLDDPARFAYLSVDDVVDLIDAPRAAIVVDFGAGTGAYALPLAERRPDLRVVALDVQPHMLALLRAKPSFAALHNIEAVDTAPDALRGRVARIFGVNVLHELPDGALATIAELLAADGRFVAIDWNATAERPVGPPPERVYRPEEAETRLVSTGFRIVARRTFPYHYALVATRSG